MKRCQVDQVLRAELLPLVIWILSVAVCTKFAQGAPRRCRHGRYGGLGWNQCQGWRRSNLISSFDFRARLQEHDGVCRRNPSEVHVLKRQPSQPSMFDNATEQQLPHCRTLPPQCGRLRASVGMGSQKPTAYIQHYSAQATGLEGKESAPSCLCL